MEHYRKAAAQPAPLDEDTLRRIGQFAKTPPAAESLFVFSVVLCDNEIDRDWDQFSTAALTALAPMMVGKTGIFDHNPQAGNQLARLFDCRVEVSDTRRNSLGEPYAALVGRAYMVRSEKNRDFIADIEAGIKKEVSISCSMGRQTCSICGKDIRRCGHTRGRQYAGRRCFAVLDEPGDAYEWSFVAVPAQRAAGVTKAKKGGTPMEEAMFKSLFTPDAALPDELLLRGSEVQALRGEIEALQKQAALGEQYRAALAGEVTRLACLAQPQLPRRTMEAVCGRLTVEELTELEKAYRAAAANVLPLQPQTAPRPAAGGKPGADAGFRI